MFRQKVQHFCYCYQIEWYKRELRSNRVTNITLTIDNQNVWFVSLSPRDTFGEGERERGRAGERWQQRRTRLLMRFWQTFPNRRNEWPKTASINLPVPKITIYFFFAFLSSHHSICLWIELTAFARDGQLLGMAKVLAITDQLDEASLKASNICFTFIFINSCDQG